MLLRAANSGKNVMNSKKIFSVITINIVVTLLLCGVVLFVINLYFDRNDTRKSIPIYFTDHSSEIRHLLKPFSSASQAGIDYTINSLGFRDREFDIKKSKGQYRILCVGDSFTFGEGVKAQEAYPQVLEKMLQTRYKNAEVINAGISGYNTVDEYLYIREKLLFLNADLIIIGFFIGNDPEDPTLPFNHKMAIPKSARIGETPLEKHIREQEHLKKLMEENYWPKYRNSIWDPEGYQWKRCKDALRGIRDLAVAKNIDLLVFVLPNTQKNPEDLLRYHFQLTNFLDELKVRHVDPLSKLRENNCVFEVVANGHPNATMHRSYAETLFEFICNNNYLKKKQSRPEVF